MPYNKTITLNEEQDMFLQENLQEYKNLNWAVRERETASVADQILALIETAPETNVT
jgi:hypothetical protein